jgi:cytochrome c-type biogenesis protein CcmH
VKQQSPIISRFWATTANAPRKATPRVRKPWSFLAVLTMLMLGSALLMLATAADNSTDARYNDLGHRLMCTCESVSATGIGGAGPACKQMVVECTHLNCTVSEPMRRKLRAAVQRGDKDDVILQSFVQEYGTSVLVNPPAINKLVWMVAFVAIAAIASTVAFVHKRQSRRAIVATPVADLRDTDVDALRRRVREETEDDDS